MDILASIIPLLGPALFEAAKTLAEKAITDPALEKGLEPFKKWLTSGYDQAKAEAALRQDALAALDETLKELPDKDATADRLVITLRLTGQIAATYTLLAATAVEMTRFDPQQIAPALLEALQLPESQRQTLARFLFHLRKRLAASEAYAPLIAYADALDQRGLLAGLSAEVAQVIANTQRTASYLELLVTSRRLTGNTQQALANYLEKVRQRSGDLMLPLIRKRSSETAKARLKQVFVPLSLRDTRAEEQAQKRGQRTKRRPDAIEMDVEAVRPASFGELLNRYDRFVLIGPPGCGKSTLLHRAALAFAEGRATEDLGWTGKPLLPILIRLRNFGVFLREHSEEFFQPAPGSLLRYLEESFRSGERMALPPTFFDDRLAEGGCLVLFDGLDEVSENRDAVAQHVNVFIAEFAAQGNRFGLASRPKGYENVEWSLRPANLALAEVNPLEPQGIRQLIHNLLTLIEPNPELRQGDCQGLDRAILGSDNPELVKIASNPLFCSALVQVYKYHGASLPQRRVDVFDEIVHLLLGFWRSQQQWLAERDRLAMEDGTGKNYREVKDAVEYKRRRLSHLAYHMQAVAKNAEIETGQAVAVLTQYLKERERVRDEQMAAEWAENFLVNSHDHSGLFVEVQPGVYAFTHKGFMEYLAATQLVNQSQSLPALVLENLADDWWEQVILLAGAHPNLPEDLRAQLITQTLDSLEQLERGSVRWERTLVMAGRMARDMGGYLPGCEREAVEDALHQAMTDSTLPPPTRANVADTLDALGWLPVDLYEFITLPNSPITQSPNLSIAKYPVTNIQYERFLNAPDFTQKEYWVDFPRFDENSQPMKKTWGDDGWKWLQETLKDKDYSPDGKQLFPRLWTDPRFGIVRRGVPVCAITWYEANAYCKWLQAHWGELEEGRDNPDLRPVLVRLPTEAEWIAAAGGDKLQERCPWDLPGRLMEDAEIIQRANVDEKVGRTTPMGMYPLGVSQPYGLWDMAGNVFEWQANHYRSGSQSLALRGGSWGHRTDLARLSARDYDPPDDVWSSYGFRVVVFPSLF
jgi:formylglycine-generating enzyme required for sulfatase activity